MPTPSMIFTPYEVHKPPQIFQRDFFLRKNVSIETFYTFMIENYIYSVLPTDRVQVYSMHGSLISEYGLELEDYINDFLIKDNVLYGIYGDSPDGIDYHISLYKLYRNEYIKRTSIFDFNNDISENVGIFDYYHDIVKTFALDASTENYTLAEINFNDDTFTFLKYLPSTIGRLKYASKFGNYYLAINLDRDIIYGLYYSGNPSDEFELRWTINLSDLGLSGDWKFYGDMKEYKGKIIVRVADLYVDNSTLPPTYRRNNRFLIINKETGEYNLTEQTQINFAYNISDDIYYPAGWIAKGDFLLYDWSIWTYGGTALYGYKMRRLGYKAI